MIREIENVYEEKLLIRSPEYKIGFSLFVFLFNIFSFSLSNKILKKHIRR